MSVTQRALSVTQQALCVTKRAPGITQRALSVTQRALSVTQLALSVTHRCRARVPPPPQTHSPTWRARTRRRLRRLAREAHAAARGERRTAARCPTTNSAWHRPPLPPAHTDRRRPPPHLRVHTRSYSRMRVRIAAEERTNPNACGARLFESSGAVSGRVEPPAAPAPPPRAWAAGRRAARPPAPWHAPGTAGWRHAAPPAPRRRTRPRAPRCACRPGTPPPSPARASRRTPRRRLGSVQWRQWCCSTFSSTDGVCWPLLDYVLLGCARVLSSRCPCRAILSLSTHARRCSRQHTPGRGLHTPG